MYTCEIDPSLSQGGVQLGKLCGEAARILSENGALHRKTLGKPEENGGKSWENPRKMVLNHGKTQGKS